MYGYRNPGPHADQRIFFGGPLLGGFVGGLLGSALVRPRPFYPYPPIPYYPYPVPYGYGYGPYGW
ncbi:MAG TPA: hypothetical protein VIG80_14035 [Bacillaceae bacterium]